MAELYGPLPTINPLLDENSENDNIKTTLEKKQTFENQNLAGGAKPYTT